MKMVLSYTMNGRELLVGSFKLLRLDWQAAYHLHGQTLGSGRKNAVLALVRSFQRCLGCWPDIGPSHGYCL